MSEPDDGERRIWSLLGLAGALGVCCLGFAGLGGGAAVTGGVTAGVIAASGTVTTLGGILVVALATALPLLAIGLVLTRRS